MAEGRGMVKGLKLGKLDLKYNESKWAVAQDWIEEEGPGPGHTEPRGTRSHRAS